MPYPDNTWQRLQTLEERPEEVGPPYIVSQSPSHIYIGWDAPLYPNGIITAYELYYGDRVEYSGGPDVTAFNYTGLQVLANHSVVQLLSSLALALVKPDSLCLVDYVYHG